MGVRIEDLPERVRPIAQRLSRQGDGTFPMVDLVAAGFLYFESKDVNEVSKLIRIAQGKSEAQAVQDNSVAARTAAKQRRKGRRDKTAKSR